jgi:curved DNA-binding protein CbpA
MSEITIDYYELLQISATADPETIHRVYRIQAQRFHPDNQETGDAKKFRAIADAYAVLSDPEKRAQYDVYHQRQRQDRWKLVEAAPQSATDIQLEQMTRLTVLEVLCTQRRVEPNAPGVFDGDMEDLIGRPREHLEFTFWYLIAKQLITRGEQSRLVITAQGVDYLEQNYSATLERRRLTEAKDEAA